MAREIKNNESVSEIGMASPFPKMTFEEFLDWDTGELLFEWVDGEVIPMGPCSYDHQSIERFLSALLCFYAEAKGSGVVLHSGYLIHLEKRPSGRLPDVLFISNERRNKITTSYLEGGCDLAVEIVSRHSRTGDRRDKFQEYEQAEVREYWVIDPIRKKAEFYVLDKSGHFHLTALDANNRFYSQVLQGLYIKVDWFWMDPLPSMMPILREWTLV